MPLDTDPVREQLAEARRNQILDAAATIFAEKGFHRATTKEIAKVAGVSEGTIYNYFDSKADLLIGLMSRLARLRELPEVLSGSLHNDTREFFVAIIQDRLGRIAENQQMLRAILPEILINPELRARFYQQFVHPTATMMEEYLRLRIQAGDIRPVNVPLAVRTVQSLFVGMLVFRLFEDETIQEGWHQMPEMLATLMFDGLSATNQG